MRRVTIWVGLISLLSGCGGGDGSSGGSGTVAATPTPTPFATPTPTSGTCSLRSRQDWAAAQLREWYLFPDTLPLGIDPDRYTSVDTFIDALTATARAQNKDRYFTYLTSIAEENAYYDGGASGGFGFRLALKGNRLFVTESFEGAAALAAGIDRGTEITAIGTSTATLQTVAALTASSDRYALGDALGDDTAGTTRVLRFVDAAGMERTATVTKTDYALRPVSTRYGTRIIDYGGQRMGYLNLRTFISTADQQLRDAFAQFRAAGVTKLVVDLRYNGGGLVSTAELMSDLMGAARSTSDVLSRVTFRPEKSAENETRLFQPQPQSIAPVKIAFIGTRGTASASEFVINAMVPYLHADVALVGTNTYGKPVGQIALDRAACDDRLRVIAFAIQNADRQGDYYNGLASTVPTTCRADDDLTNPLGDMREASISTALAWLAGGQCTPIASSSARALATATGRTMELLSPARPTTAQREVPGLF